MAKVYIVTASDGDYEDAWTENLVASTDHDKAQAYVDDLLAKQKEWNIAVEQVKVAEREYLAKLRSPEYENLIPLTPWPSGLGKHQITQEMKNERLKAELLNKQISDRNGERAVRYLAEYEEQKREILVALGYTDSDPIMAQHFVYTNLVAYQINEVDLI